MQDGFIYFFTFQMPYKNVQRPLNSLSVPPVGVHPVGRKMSSPGSDVSKPRLLEKEWGCDDEESIQDCD